MRRAEPVAGLGGVLLLVSLFLPWYGLPKSPFDDGPLLSTYSGDTVLSAVQVFSVIDILLAAIAVVAIAVPIVSLTASGPAKPIATQVIASVLGGFGVLLVLFRLVDAPYDGFELRYGAWLGLAGALIAWVGSWLSLRDESAPGVPLPDVPRRPAPPASAA